MFDIKYIVYVNIYTYIHISCKLSIEPLDQSAETIQQNSLCSSLKSFPFASLFQDRERDPIDRPVGLLVLVWTWSKPKQYGGFQKNRGTPSHHPF